MPTVMRSPSFKSTEAMCFPLTSVPLVEPRSGEPPNVGRLAEDLCMRAACIEVVEHDVAVGGAPDEHAGVGEWEGAIGGHVDECGRWLSRCTLLVVEHHRVRDRDGLCDRGGLRFKLVGIWVLLVIRRIRLSVLRVTLGLHIVMRLRLLIGVGLRVCGHAIARLLGKTVAFELFVAQLSDDRAPIRVRRSRRICHA